MDAGRNNEEELSRGIQHLEQLVTQGAELLPPLNNELQLIILQSDALQKQIKLVHLISKTDILDYLNKELQEVSKNDAEENADKRTAQLRKVFISLVSMLGGIYGILRQRKMQMADLKRKLEQELKEAALKKPEEGANEGKDNQEKSAVDVFPLEVWQVIGDRLEKSEDLRNLAKADVALDAVLERKKTSFLFDQVLPNLAKFLKPQDILSCRQVCKPWREGVNSFLESQHFSATSSNNVQLFTKLRGVSSMVRFNNEMTLHRNSNLNPFPSRALSLNETHSGNASLAYFKEQISWTGVHLSSLNYCTTGWATAGFLTNPTDISPRNLIYYMDLRDLLTCVPNLRHLSLTGGIEEEEDSQLMFQTQENIPLPDLPKLETLLFERYPVYRALRWLFPSYCHQLKELNLWEAPSVFELEIWRADLTGDNRDRHAFQFPKLKSLRVGMIVGNQALNALLNLVEAPELENFLVDQQYQHMNNFGFERRNDDIPEAGNLLFQILNRFPKLKHLKILYQHNYGDNDVLRSTLEQVASQQAGVYAPETLETLELQTSTNLSYSFLLRFPYLRNLHLHQKCLPLRLVRVHKFYMATQLESVVLQSLFTFSDDRAAEFKGLFGIYSSNIWKLLPNLEEIVVNARTHCGNVENKFVYRREFSKELH